MKKEEKKEMKLSYESDGKMGKENMNEKNQVVDSKNEFFNITQGSE